MGNKKDPRFHLPCSCYSNVIAKLRDKKMVVHGLTLWSDKDGSNGLGCTFQSYGPPVRGKVQGGLIKFTYCPFCGSKIKADWITLIDDPKGEN